MGEKFHFQVKGIGDISDITVIISAKSVLSVIAEKEVPSGTES